MSQLRVLAVTALRAALELARYNEHIVALVFSPVQYVLPALFTLRMLTGGRTVDDSVVYVLAGTLMWSWLHNCLWSVSDFLRREQVTGTLETVLSTPCSRTAWLLGGALGMALFQLAGIAVTAGVTGIMFRAACTPNWPAVTIVSVLSLAAGWSLSLFVACLVMYLKETVNVLSVIVDSTFILSGATYPIGNLQSWALALAMCLPFSWAIAAIRLALSGANTTQLSAPILGLALATALLTFSGSALFARTERRVKRLGTLAQY